MSQVLGFGRLLVR